MKARTSLPDDSQLAALLGAISFELKDYVYAIQLLQDSSRSKPLEAKELYYMGMAYLETKNPSKARELLTQSLEAGLGDPLAAEARGALERTGK